MVKLKYESKTFGTSAWVKPTRMMKRLTRAGRWTVAVLLFRSSAARSAPRLTISTGCRVHLICRAPGPGSRTMTCGARSKRRGMLRTRSCRTSARVSVRLFVATVTTYAIACVSTKNTWTLISIKSLSCGCCSILRSWMRSVTHVCAPYESSSWR